MKKVFRIFLRTIESLVILLFLFIVIFHKLVSYGIDQAIGQLNIVWSARPIEDVMKDASVNDTIKLKLRFVEEIKKYAIDSLGLKASENYTTLYDQHRKPALWVLTASEKYQMKSFEWWFPVVGNVGYKGFFVFDKGKDEQKELDEKGYDTDYNPTSAWSTLGWFRDPILSNFLYKTDGQIAELIIHEMTHATLYVKSSVDFNENLASVIGEAGAEQFLKYKYGDSSEVLKEYLNRNEDYNRFAQYMIAGTKKLDSVYHSFNSDDATSFKDEMKQKTIKEIVASLDTISFHNRKRYEKLFEDELPNNAYFLGFTRYDALKDKMKKEMKEEARGDIKMYIEQLKIKYK